MGGPPREASPFFSKAPVLLIFYSPGLTIYIMIKEKISTMRDRDIRYVLFRFFLLAIILISLIIILSYLITLDRRPLVNTLTMIGIISLCLILYKLSGRPERYSPSSLTAAVVRGTSFTPCSSI